MIGKSVERRPDGTFAIKAGEVTESVGRALLAAVRRELRTGVPIVVDLDRVEHIGREGAFVFLLLGREAVGHAADLTFRNAHAPAAKRLRTLGLEHIARIEWVPDR